MQRINTEYVTARAGGGGSSSGGGGHSSGGSGFHGSSSGGSGGVPASGWSVALFFIVFFGLFIFSFFVKSKKVFNGIKGFFVGDPKVRSEADQILPGWKDKVQTLFLQFQIDWGTKNLQSMQQYLSTEYFQHVQLVLMVMQQLGRTDTMSDVRILNTLAVRGETSLSVQFTAIAHDVLTEDTSKTTLNVSDNMFLETWHFSLDQRVLRLAGISQATEDSAMTQQSLKNFATANQLFYSPDWGSLLLPSRGQLFHRGSFANSDINNHCIGMYRELLVQLYTYVENAKSGSGPNYVIAQTVLPKTYGNIVVRHKKLISIGIKGLNKISLEWEDFNKRYEVFADNVEQVTSFELLHPVFMEKLFALDYEVNIEVFDNSLYLYTTDSNASYESMFGILNDAFNELKL
jgi:hypothetical protein